MTIKVILPMNLRMASISYLYLTSAGKDLFQTVKDTPSRNNSKVSKTGNLSFGERNIMIKVTCGRR